MNTEIKQLIDNFSEVFKTIHQKSYHKTENKCLYPGQPKLLALIKAHEGLTQKTLAERNCVTPATITGMLNKLEANHYVYRLPDEIDKRSMRVYLTPEGQQLANDGEKFMLSMMEKVFDNFTPEELQTLINFTEKMKANVSKL